jgi:hypothetical protein
VEIILAMSLQSRPPKLSSPTKRMIELTPDEVENQTPSHDITIGNFIEHNFKNNIDRIDGPEDMSALSEAPTLVSSPSQMELSPSNITPTIPKEIKALLFTFPLFQGIGDATQFIDEISKVLHMRKYSVGDVVLRQGSSARAMFFIVKGTLKVISEDGEIVIGELSNGTYCKPVLT